MNSGKVRSSKSARAAKARAELIQALGGRCSNCASPHNLQFDCKVPRGHDHHRMDWPTRIRFYWQEHLAGNIQILCAECHVQKTRYDNSKARAAKLILAGTRASERPSAFSWPEFPRISARVVTGESFAFGFFDGDGI